MHIDLFTLLRSLCIYIVFVLQVKSLEQQLKKSQKSVSELNGRVKDVSCANWINTPFICEVEVKLKEKDKKTSLTDCYSFSCFSHYYSHVLTQGYPIDRFLLISILILNSNHIYHLLSLCFTWMEIKWCLFVNGRCSFFMNMQFDLHVKI